MEKKLDQLLARQRETSSKLEELDNILQSRELNADEQKQKSLLLAEYENRKREIEIAAQEQKAISLTPKKSSDAELREFLRKAERGSQFIIPVSRESISYGSQGTGHFGGTDGIVQGITVVDLIPTDRPDGDILTTAGVPMTIGVEGNKIQWAFAGGVEAVFANELAATTERVISLDKQTPIQQRLTVRVRISNQALENSTYDLQAFIVRLVADSIRKKINWAAASTTKATETFFGPFAQAAEVGTYGADGYVPGKQTGSYTTFTKETAAEMIGKLASHNLDTDNVVFVMGAEDFWKLKVTPFDEGSGIMLIGNDNRLLGIPVLPNNAINRATEKGAISGHNIGLGNFKYLPVMQHGNIRLSVDSGSAVASSTDEVYTTINADFSMTILKDGADAFVLYAKSGEDTH